ncbi:hypothetical protein KY290_027125 [Solanum tuberosum]|uniref:Uncharacterized protein n=1 Tax=Solanum tuberosum TaxID=4113 RepID=A0ABQ7UFV9_SOLTU|nr:hypothetical protein KY284_026087 [Solanum tuberosum]KAH0747893.1 hypothetical protein KY290_027125 [Solanum tuberosum]
MRLPIQKSAVLAGVALSTSIIVAAINVRRKEKRLQLRKKNPDKKQNSDAINWALFWGFMWPNLLHFGIEFGHFFRDKHNLDSPLKPVNFNGGMTMWMLSISFAPPIQETLVMTIAKIHKKGVEQQKNGLNSG